MTASRRTALATALALVLTPAMPLRAQPAATFDTHHAAWTALLQKHVQLQRGGQASTVRYAGLAADRDALAAYLGRLSALSPADYAAFTPAQQKAFLINAYNAFTVELILTRYPKLESIKDLGSLLQSPWKKAWIPLLGRTVSLDNIEHGLLRERGRFDDPRIHFAVNCASIGCPMLREEAYVAERLDAQLEQQTQRFLSDRTRNRYNAARGRLEVSKIFDWYGEDFGLGHRGIRSLPAFFAAHAELLADAPADRERLRSQKVELSFLDYDWALNDAKR